MQTKEPVGVGAMNPNTVAVVTSNTGAGAVAVVVGAGVAKVTVVVGATKSITVAGVA